VRRLLINASFSSFQSHRNPGMIHDVNLAKRRSDRSARHLRNGSTIAARAAKQPEQFRHSSHNVSLSIRVPRLDSKSNLLRRRDDILLTTTAGMVGSELITARVRVVLAALEGCTLRKCELRRLVRTLQ
jgi:hypothetical protein